MHWATSETRCIGPFSAPSGTPDGETREITLAVNRNDVSSSALA